jgi:hypothetical protein
MKRAFVIFLPALAQARASPPFVNNGPLFDDHMESSDRHGRHVLNPSRS